MFKDRRDAGGHLVKALKKYETDDVVVLGIARGGVVVGYEVAKGLKATLEVIMPRKIPIPWNPEAGFGAITEDGTTVLNEPLVEYLRLRGDEIKEVSMKVLREIRRRIRKYRGDRPFPDIDQKIVILVDDGLASGFTMIAAIEMVKKYTPKRIVVAVSVSPRTSINRVRPLVDELVCLYVQEYGDFAVASYYEEFPDISDEEVLAYLKTRPVPKDIMKV